MKKMLLIAAMFYCIIGVASAQSVGNNEDLSLTETNINGVLTNPVASATVINSMQILNNTPNIKIITSESGINFRLDFFASNYNYSRYIFSSEGVAKTIYPMDTEQTYSITVNIGSESQVNTSIDISYVANGVTYPGGSINIEVLRQTIPETPTSLTASRSGDGGDVDLSWNSLINASTLQVQHRTAGGSWSTKTINSNVSNTTINNLGYSALEFRVRAGNSDGYSAYSTIETLAALNLNPVTDLEVYKPYYYNLKWTDPNNLLLKGTIEVQRGSYRGDPNSLFYTTIATINDFHATNYYIGSTQPSQAYRLKFTDSSGRVSYSNEADQTVFSPVTDLEVWRPYYYNLKWTDPAGSLLTGTIEVQKGIYRGDPNSLFFYTIATINDFHATNYYLGSTQPTQTFRLKFTDSVGNVYYSNEASYGSTGGRVALLGANEKKGSYESFINEELVIYPVPASKIINVKNISPDVESYSVFTIAGKKLYQKNIIPNQFQTEIDISLFEEGLYFIRLSDGITKRFVVE